MEITKSLPKHLKGAIQGLEELLFKMRVSMVKHFHLTQKNFSTFN